MIRAPVVAQPAADAGVEAVGQAGGLPLQALEQDLQVSLWDPCRCRPQSTPACHLHEALIDPQEPNMYILYLPSPQNHDDMITRCSLLRSP